MLTWRADDFWQSGWGKGFGYCRLNLAFCILLKYLTYKLKFYALNSCTCIIWYHSESVLIWLSILQPKSFSVWTKWRGLYAPVDGSDTTGTADMNLNHQPHMLEKFHGLLHISDVPGKLLHQTLFAYLETYYNITAASQWWSQDIYPRDRAEAVDLETEPRPRQWTLETETKTLTNVSRGSLEPRQCLEDYITAASNY